jgi:hypothetical protein
MAQSQDRRQRGPGSGGDRADQLTSLKLTVHKGKRKSAPQAAPMPFILDSVRTVLASGQT